MAESATQAIEQGRAPGAVAGRAQIAERLTDRQARYVEHRAAGKRPYQAGILSGLAVASCRHTVSRWEADPRIVEGIAAAASEAATEARVSPADVIRELAILAFSTLDDYEIHPFTGVVTPAKDAPEYVMRAVKKIKHRIVVSGATEEDRATEYRTEIELWEKPAALKMLGEVMGIFLKRVRVEDDVETKATLGALRGIMDKALRRQAVHAAEEAEIGAFREPGALREPTHQDRELMALANAGALAVDSPNPLQAMREMAARVTQAAQRLESHSGGSDADGDRDGRVA